MENKDLQEIIQDFGKQMGFDNLELDFNDNLQIEMESGEVLHLELTDTSLLVYLSIELLPYIVTRTLEKLYIETNYKENSVEPIHIGLYNSHIILAVHIEFDVLTSTHLIKTSENLWHFKEQVID